MSLKKQRSSVIMVCLVLVLTFLALACSETSQNQTKTTNLRADNQSSSFGSAGNVRLKILSLDDYDLCYDDTKKEWVDQEDLLRADLEQKINEYNPIKVNTVYVNGHLVKAEIYY